MILPLDAPSAVDAPGTKRVTSAPPADHLALRQALRADRRLVACIVVTSVPNRWTRRRVALMLSAARRRGQVASITLEGLRLAAVVEGTADEDGCS